MDLRKYIRSIIAIMLAITFCYLAVMEKITAEAMIVAFSFVTGYYFGERKAKNAIDPTNDDINISG
ncbi:MAG: hypothetical protein ACW990_05570 [Promethearchaeota archaeon]|jgi:hypothetical protein